VRAIDLVVHFKKMLRLPCWSACQAIASSNAHKFFELCSSETVRRITKNTMIAQCQTKIDQFDTQELAQTVSIIAKQLPQAANSRSKQFVDQISQNMLGINMGHHCIFGGLATQL